MNGQKAVGHIFFMAAAIAVLWISPAFSNTYPPTPTQHFYGDTDGDTLITTFDLGILANYFNGQPYTFDTLQPQNPDQDWNTCDIDSDRHCTTFDLGVYANSFNGQTVTIGDKPWVLQNVNLPLTGNTPNIWNPFTINLYSTLPGPVRSGRPGVSIVAEIAPVGEGSTVTGQLSGRECVPVEGSRDQAAQVGAQCALSVTTTDWGIAPGTALTESGTYGFALRANGNGNIKLRIRVEENASLDTPAVSISQTISFSPRVWYVKAGATGANNGTSWADAFTVLQNGVDAASAGDQVWVAQGIYTNSSVITLTMKDGVSIYGGFAGAEDDLMERNVAINKTTIRNEGRAGCPTVVRGVSNARLDGFYVVNPGSSAICGGPGVWNTYVTNLVIANCDFEDIMVWMHGGELSGGAIINENSSVAVINCTFARNYVSGKGGAIFSSGSSVAITNCVFFDNCGSKGGGALANVSSTVNVVNCLFNRNNNISGYGGAFQNDSSTVNIYNCTLVGNYSDNTGGIYNINSSNATISNSILWGNASPEISGGATVRYSDIQGGYSGTGNINLDPIFTISISGTWTSDSTYAYGYTTYTDTTQSWAPSSLKNYWLKIGNDYFSIYNNTATTIRVKGDFPSPAGTSYAVITDFHLDAASPCVNTGTSAGAPADDLDGYPRPYPAMGLFDMGAYEWHP